MRLGVCPLFLARTLIASGGGEAASSAARGAVGGPFASTLPTGSTGGQEANALAGTGWPLSPFRDHG